MRSELEPFDFGLHRPDQTVHSIMCVVLAFAIAILYAHWAVITFWTCLGFLAAAALSDARRPVVTVTSVV